MERECIKALRGATSIARDEPQEIQERVRELFSALLAANNLEITNIISVIFTVTHDICSLNPATALRDDDRYQHIPLLCALEPRYQGDVPLIIRVLLHVRVSSAATALTPCYLHDAVRLRPDFNFG